MKIIITENQYRVLESQQTDNQRTVRALRSIWQHEIDTTGEVLFDNEIGQYIGYDEYKNICPLIELFRDFLGGWNKMAQKSYTLMDRTFDTRDYYFSGGYNFRFKTTLNNEEDEDNTIYVNSEIESDGKVTLMSTGETLFLSEVEEDVELYWEIESEIRNLIEDILYYEVTKKTGIMVDVNTYWIKE